MLKKEIALFMSDIKNFRVTANKIDELKIELHNLEKEHIEEKLKGTRSSIL